MFLALGEGYRSSGSSSRRPGQESGASGSSFRPRTAAKRGYT